jgi:SAM-dependent methyltransferase
MYIFQPDRFLLDQQIRRFAHYVSGRTLDVGAGSFNRYQRYFQVSSYVKTDHLAGPNVDVVASADQLPFGPAEFDSVVSTQVFEHLAQPALAAKEIARVLKTGGHLLLTVPQLNELHEEPHDYWRYTKYGLIALFKEAGFEVVVMDARGAYYSTLAQIRIRHWMGIFNLYQRPVLGRLASKFFSIYGRLMINLDRVWPNQDNQKQTIGWCAVFKKI